MAKVGAEAESDSDDDDGNDGDNMPLTLMLINIDNVFHIDILIRQSVRPTDRQTNHLFV